MDVGQPQAADRRLPVIDDHRELRGTLRGWPGAREGSELPSEQVSLAFEQYKLYVELTDRISERRQTANSFFVGVNTGIVALLGFLGPDRQFVRAERVYFLISVAGVVLCLLWYRIIRSYRDLNTARFAIIHEMEETLPFRPYTAEWQHVGHGNVSRLYKPLTHIETGVPWLFFVLYCGVFLALILGA